MVSDIERRKKEHLDLSLDSRVQTGDSGLSSVRLPYDALFEVRDEDLDTRAQMAGIPLRFPLMIGAMTGGTQAALEFNSILRKISADRGIAMCLGSMRAALCHPELINTYGCGACPALFANIGAAEIGCYSVDAIASMCRQMGASGLFIHLNGLQEWVQPGGARDFSCRFDQLAEFAAAFPMPVFFKEVGSGIGGRCAKRLALMKISGIETAGRGGTSWVGIESMRRQPPLRPETAASLDALGYSTLTSIRAARSALGSRTVIASGGIRTPLDIVRAIAAGADIAAAAQPLYAAYHEGGADLLGRCIDEWIAAARLIWRSTGAGNAAELRRFADDENNINYS